MTDQCKHCTFKGDIEKCLSAECFHHENWYARQQSLYIARLEKELYFHFFNGAAGHGATQEKATAFARERLQKLREGTDDKS